MAGTTWPRTAEARHERRSRSETASGLTHLSTYARGLDGPLGHVPVLDRAPGAHETGVGGLRHDEYEKG